MIILGIARAPSSHFSGSLEGVGEGVFGETDEKIGRLIKRPILCFQKLKGDQKFSLKASISDFLWSFGSWKRAKKPLILAR